MKILYIGGQRSGKSEEASNRAISLSKSKPIYLATYQNSYSDKDMQNRIDRHIKKRDNKFTLIEEPLSLYKAISMADSLVLVDCISMWLFNRLQIGHSFDEILDELRAILTLPQDIIFILNDISTSIAPIDKESRDFVDISGLAGGVLAQNCNEVYQVIYTISKRIK